MKKIALGKYDNFLPSFVINCIQVYEVGLSHPLAAAAMLISLMLHFNSIVNIVLCIWPLFIQLIQIFFSHWHYVYSSKIGSIKLFDAYMDALVKEFYVRHVNGSPMNTESDKLRVNQCLEAAMERRVSEVTVPCKVICRVVYLYFIWSETLTEGLPLN
jgi:hypothetical protein